MAIQQQLEQIEASLDKLHTEIADTQYFIENALCKETQDIYRQTLREKQSELYLVESQKEQLLKQVRNNLEV